MALRLKILTSFLKGYFIFKNPLILIKQQKALAQFKTSYRGVALRSGYNVTK